jgi:hypothetical protein
MNTGVGILLSVTRLVPMFYVSLTCNVQTSGIVLPALVDPTIVSV